MAKPILQIIVGSTRPGRVGDGGADLAEPPRRALDEAPCREAQTEDEEVHAAVFPA